MVVSAKRWYFCRLFCGLDDIYCLFLGSLNNLSLLNKQYGLSKGTDEAMFLIEAYRTLRDRGPYPPDQVVKELDGSFAFVVYDSTIGTVFAALVYIFVTLPCSLLTILQHLNQSMNDVFFYAGFRWWIEVVLGYCS